MTDGVIKGTGNSWNLKSVPNFLTLYPTYDAFVQALVAGTLPIDLNGMNAAGWSTQGTRLNKASLLADATEKAIWGTASNRTVNQGLAQLRTLIKTAQSAAEARSTVVTGSYAGAGVAVGDGIDNADTPVVLTFASPPKLVAIGSRIYGELTLVKGAPRAYMTSYYGGTNSGYFQNSVLWEGNSVKFWGYGAHMNSPGETYYYTAIL